MLFRITDGISPVNERMSFVSFEIVRVAVRQAIWIKSQKAVMGEKHRPALIHSQIEFYSEIGLAVVIIGRILETGFVHISPDGECR